MMLGDIQRALGLREDEVLAMLNQTWNFNVGTTEVPMKYQDFVLDDPILGPLDTCCDPPKALEI